jgi:FHA domain
MARNILDLLTLAKDPNVLLLLLIMLAVIVSLVLIFRKELGDRLSKLKKAGFRWGNVDFAFEFGEGVARAHPTGLREDLSQAVSRPLRSANKAVDFDKQSARDVVLEAWSALKQSVYNACAAKGISLTPLTSIEEAARRLAESNDIKTEVRQLIASLDQLGGQLASNKRFNPDEKAAREYKEVADGLMDWMTWNVLWPTPQPPPPPPPSRRPTMVGGNVLPPTPSRSTAVLVGVAGPVRGQRFAINKTSYRLGRSVNCDLRITADGSVSGEHASLRYEKGGLFLSDQGSRNGTFLNEQRVSGAPLLVRHGDRIRVGECVFEVAGTAPVSRLNEEKEAELNPAPNPTIVR